MSRCWLQATELFRRNDPRLIETFLACRAVTRLSIVEPARLRALRYGAAAFGLASLLAKDGARCRF